MLSRMFQAAHDYNVKNIADLICQYGVRPKRFCDLGAGDGAVTKQILKSLQCDEVHVAEVEGENVQQLGAAGFVVHHCDLNAKLPIESDAFDVVVANQVIEHLYDTELFLEEVHRITSPGGIAIISTENLASWHNVAALFLGWQPFSLTNVSARTGGLGNPVALHRDSVGWPFPLQHHRLFTTRMLRELMALHGFTELRTAGSGYYPLPARFGRLEPSHAHFIVVGGRK